MAFVRAAEATNNSTLSGISAFFFSSPMLLSGTDYYTAKEGINVGDNTLYIETASPRLPQIGTLQSNSNFTSRNTYPTYINFSLFPNLSVLEFQFNNVIPTIDVRANASIKYIYNYNTGITGLQIVGTPVDSIDVRDSNLTFLNISGCNIYNLNLGNSKLSAISFRDGVVAILAMDRNPIKLPDFSECDTRFLSSLQSLRFSPENQYTANSPKLSTFNFTGPLSSITTLLCENNHLSSLSLVNLPTLRYVDAGYNTNKQSQSVSFTGGNRLSSLDLRNLHALTYLDISYNPLTAVNLDATLLSALETLKVQGWSPFTPGLIDLNTQLFNLSSQTNLKNLYINDNSNLLEINFLDYPVNFKNSLINLSAYNCTSLSNVEITPLRFLQKLDLQNSTHLSSLNLFSLTALDTLNLLGTRVSYLTAPIIPNNLRNFLIGGVSGFNFPSLNNLNELTLGTGLSTATFTTLSSLSALFIGRTALRDISLQGLSSLQIFYYGGFFASPALSSIVTTNFDLPSLRYVNLIHGLNPSNRFSSLSSVCFSGFNALGQVVIAKLPLVNLNLSNNKALTSIFIDQDLLSNLTIMQPNLQPTLIFSNLTALKDFTLYGSSWRQSNSLRQLLFTDSPSLQNFAISFYPALSVTNFTDSINLENIYVSYVGLSSNLILNSCSNLQYVNYTNTGCTNASITNAPALSTAYLWYNKLSSFSISNAPELRGLYLTNNKLSSLELKDFLRLKNLEASSNLLTDTNTFNTNLCAVDQLGLGTNSLTSCNLSSFKALRQLVAVSNKLSALNFNNNPCINSLQLNNNDLRSLDVTPLTGLETLYTANNYNLTSIKLGSTQLLGELHVPYSNLTQENIDTLMIQACAGGSLYIYDYSNNPTGRSSYSNDSYTHLHNIGALLIPDEPNNTVSQPKPALTIVSPVLPASLAYTQTLSLSATAYYIGNSVPTFYSVLSGPGVTLSPTVSALSGTGTITVLVSSLSTTVFAPATALFDITLTKLNVSNIQFSNTGFVYDGNVKSVSAFSTSYPELSYNIIYLSGGIAVSPIETGSYIVSAIVTDGNYEGSASTTMTIYPAGFYILPAGAKSTLIYSSSGFDTKKDIVVTFDYAFYGQTTQAGEGFCVSFIGYTPIVSGGAPGYGLNYTNASFLSTNPAGDAGFKNYDGLYSGILGIGFDSTGNFGTSSFGVTGLPTAVPNSIAVRGGFYDDYQIITRTASLSSFANPTSIYQQVTGSDTPVYRRIRIRLTDLGKKLIVQQKELSAENFFTYLDYNLGDLTPNAIRPCLSYSSGLTAASFKIKNFNINGYFNNDYNEPVEPTTFDTSVQIPISGGPAGSFGITFTSLYQSDIISYDSKLPTDLPLTMDVYINGAFVATVDFDPVYIGEKFVYFKFNTQTNYEGIFAPGSVQVL